LYSQEPLVGELGNLPENWESKVLSWPPKRLWTQVRLSIEMLLHAPDVLFVPAHVVPIVHPQKTVMTVHDIAASRFAMSYSWFERWYSMWSARQACAGSGLIIVPSRFTKDEIVRVFGISIAKQVRVVPHGYDTSFARQAPPGRHEEVLRTYGVVQPFVLSIGRLEEKKNTANMVRAFCEFKKESGLEDLTYVLVGKQGHGYETVRSAIAQSSFDHDVIELGWVAQADLPVLLQSAEALLFVSLYEGFGLPVLEAFAAGTPVITSKGTSLDEVGDGAVRSCDPHSVPEIVSALSAVLTDEKIRTRLIAGGKDRVSQFSWKKAAAMTLEFLLEQTEQVEKSGSL